MRAGPGEHRGFGVGPSRPSQFAVTPHAPAGSDQSVPASPGLPFTGADIEQIIGIASVLLVGGVVLVRTNRRRARTAL